MEIDQLLKLMICKNASDLHLTVPSPPVLRINGLLITQEDLPPFNSGDIEAIFEKIVTQEQKDVFTKQLELDFAYSVAGLARVRVNALRQRGSLSLAIRLVPFRIPSLEELELPRVCKELILKSRGLLLISGIAGSGKSTTMAAMVNYLNENTVKNIITIEEPIEYLFKNNKCIIRQRDLGEDTRSFHNALLSALRHDPDVIMIGEMRDLQIINTAINAAETGHLVIGILSAQDSIKAIESIIEVFPSDQKQQGRQRLCDMLIAVIHQVLLSRLDGGRIAAYEMMINNTTIKRLLVKEKSYEILANMEASKNEGMQTLDFALADLLKRKLITLQDALEKCNNPVKLQNLLQV